jgi:hypothetical protein
MVNRAFQSIQQVPLKHMERGLARPVATLKLEPAEISKRLGLKFQEARDDLDELEAAVFRSAKGHQFALVRHRNQPNPGKDLLINGRSRNLGGALRDALQTLRLQLGDIKWTDPKASIQETNLLRRTDRSTLNSTALHRAAQLQEQIESLESQRDQILQSTGRLGSEIRQGLPARAPLRRRTPAQRVSLASAIVRVLRRNGKPMDISQILDELLAIGYKFRSPKQKKALSAKIYRVKGVRKVSPTKFVAE